MVASNLPAGLAAALIAAVLFNAGLVLQAADVRAVSASTPRGRFGLAGQLVRRRRWVAGTALTCVGWPFQVLALSFAPVVVVEPAPEGETHKYGIVALDGQDGRLNRMTGMVEKPPLGTEPSNLFISGRYVLTPDIFPLLADQQSGAGGEIQLTDAMATLMRSQDFTAVEYEGVTHDCGDKIGLLRANVALALKRPDLGEAARAAVTALL